VNAAIVGYYSSGQFRKLRPVTKEGYRRILENFRAHHGDKRVALMERKHVKMLLDEKADKPEAARNLLRTLRVLLQHAVEMGMRIDNPALGIRLGRRKGDGYRTWTEQEIERFEACHSVGSKARLALALGIYSGQRRSDVVALGPRDIREGVLLVTQSKTGVRLSQVEHYTKQADQARLARTAVNLLKGESRTSSGKLD
jgi:integrase